MAANFNFNDQWDKNGQKVVANWDAIIEKYDRHFPDSPEVILDTMRVVKNVGSLQKQRTLLVGHCTLKCDTNNMHIEKVTSPSTKQPEESAVRSKRDKQKKKDVLNASYAVSVQGVPYGIFEDSGGSDVESVASSEEEETKEDDESPEQEHDNAGNIIQEETLSTEDSSECSPDEGDDDDDSHDESGSDEYDFDSDISVVSGPSCSIHRRLEDVTVESEQETVTHECTADDRPLVQDCGEKQRSQTERQSEVALTNCDSDPGPPNTELDMGAAIDELETLLSTDHSSFARNSMSSKTPKVKTSNLQTLFEQLKASCPAKIVPSARITPTVVETGAKITLESSPRTRATSNLKRNNILRNKAKAPASQFEATESPARNTRSQASLPRSPAANRILASPKRRITPSRQSGICEASPKRRSPQKPTCGQKSVDAAYSFGLFAKNLDNIDGGEKSKSTDVDSGLSTNVETSSTDSNESSNSHGVSGSSTPVKRRSQFPDRSRPYPTRQAALRTIETKRKGEIPIKKGPSTLSSIIHQMQSDCESTKQNVSSPKSRKQINVVDPLTPKNRPSASSRLTPKLSKLSLGSKLSLPNRATDDAPSLMCSTPVKRGSAVLDISMISAIHESTVVPDRMEDNTLTVGSDVSGDDADDSDGDLQIIDEIKVLSPPKSFRSPRPVLIDQTSRQQTSRNLHDLITASAPAKMKTFQRASPVCNTTFVVKTPTAKVTRGSEKQIKMSKESPKCVSSESPRRLRSSVGSAPRRATTTLISPAPLRRFTGPLTSTSTHSVSPAPTASSKEDPYAMSSSESDNSDTYELFQEFEEQVRKNKSSPSKSPFKTRNVNKNSTDGLLLACGLFVGTPVSSSPSRRKKFNVKRPSSARNAKLNLNPLGKLSPAKKPLVLLPASKYPNAHKSANIAPSEDTNSDQCHRFDESSRDSSVKFNVDDASVNMTNNATASFCLGPSLCTKSFCFSCSMNESS